MQAPRYRKAASSPSPVGDRRHARLSLKRTRSAIIERFGEDARFHACSAEGMTATERVYFLADRNKFMPAGDGFIVNPERVCPH